MDQQNELLPSNSRQSVLTVSRQGRKSILAPPDTTDGLSRLSEKMPSELCPPGGTAASSIHDRYTQPNDFSDVVFIVEDKKLYLHSQVLANRSPVFAQWFKSGFKEKAEVPLADKRYVDFCEFLNCFYCYDTVSIHRENAIMLLEFAEEFDVDFLKRRCVDILMIEVENYKTPKTPNDKPDPDIEYRLQCLTLAWEFKIDKLFAKTVKLLSRYKLTELQRHKLYSNMDSRLARELLEERIRHLEPLTERHGRHSEKAEQELTSIYEIMLDMEKYAENVVKTIQQSGNRNCHCSKEECATCAPMKIANTILRLVSKDSEYVDTLGNSARLNWPKSGSNKPGGAGDHDKLAEVFAQNKAKLALVVPESPPPSSGGPQPVSSPSGVIMGGALPTNTYRRSYERP